MEENGKQLIAEETESPIIGEIITENDFINDSDNYEYAEDVSFTFHKIMIHFTKLTRASVIILIFLYLLDFFVASTQALGYGLAESILLDLGFMLLFFLGDFLVTLIANKLFHKDMKAHLFSPVKSLYDDFSTSRADHFETKKTRKKKKHKAGKVDATIAADAPADADDIYTNMLN